MALFLYQHSFFSFLSEPQVQPPENVSESQVQPPENVSEPQVQPPENVFARDIQDSNVTIVWDLPKGLSENVVLGYKVTLYDAHTVLRIIKTPNRKLKFMKLNQFSKYYVTVQVETKDGYGLPSAQLIIQTKGLLFLLAA